MLIGIIDADEGRSSLNLLHRSLLNAATKACIKSERSDYKRYEPLHFETKTQ